MENYRIYGAAPYRIAVIHGGPGAGGEMAPVARELSATQGVIEPMQTAMSVDGQIEELREVLKEEARTPVILIGHSWGAWLSCMLAAKYPDIVSKLILVASAPFEEKFVKGIYITRLSHLDTKARAALVELSKSLVDPAIEDKLPIFQRFGQLLAKADAYSPITIKDEAIDLRPDIFKSVWPEAARLRSSGELLALASRITCPVVAIHGDHDPHPAEGVEMPLAGALEDFQFILLKHCGHRPWAEKEASDKFYEIVTSESFSGG